MPERMLRLSRTPAGVIGGGGVQDGGLQGGAVGLVVQELGAFTEGAFTRAPF